MRLTKTLGAAGALILSALVGGTLIGSALATDESTDTDTTAAATEYCDVFMDALASELGATRDALVSAGKAAATAAVDAALEAGDITEERATAIRERIDAADGSGCAWFGHGFVRGFEHGVGRGFLGGDVFEAAAAALGIESAELIDRVDAAGSLEALATEEGVAYDEVKASVLAAVEADLDAAVAEGLDQARADEVIERLTTWLDEGGELAGGPGHIGPGRGEFGPWRQGERNDTDAEESGA
ncbi:MAG TPA: hypothetical protein VEW95_09575 [Candidatus Limnocylindrales bacterium]|nr:hypothetical protein [Candidatus Limnocylindrales bacterium]